MKKILIVQLRPGIGDMCIFLSSIKEISEKNPSKEIYLLTKERSRSKNFLKDETSISKIFYLEDIHKKKLPKFFLTLFFFLKHNFFSIYIMHYGIKYLIISKLSGIKNIYHYGLLKRNENISKKMKDATENWLGVKNFDTTAYIKYNGEIINKSKILIGVGSSGETRKWSPENYLILIKKISKMIDCDFIILGGPNEKGIVEKIKKVGEGIKIISLCDYKIYDTFKFIKNSVLYVGTDSGFMHISAALSVRTFGLFGDTPTNYSEYSKRIIPILPEGVKHISHNSRAMNLIKPEYVFSKIKTYL